MYFTDHQPPHFHAKYRGTEAVIRVDNLDILKGKLPGRTRARVKRRAEIHRDELFINWEEARKSAELAPIEPLA